MPFQPLDRSQWQRAFSRAAIVGQSGSWKTTSALTWPRPLHILLYPGEHGGSSIPEGEKDVIAHTWVEDPKRQGPRAVVTAVEKLTTEILSGVHGPCTTFFGDGFHKFYGIIYDACLEDLLDAFPTADKDRLGGRAYGLAHAEAFRYFRKVQSSSVPYVVLTMWAGPDRDDPENPKSAQHMWPDLPGAMARKVMGEFGVVLYAEPGVELAPAIMKDGKVVKPARFSPGTWQLRRAGKVWGAGIKLPLEIASQLPTTVPQDWQHLEKLVQEAAHEPREP